ncbi:MAG: hypothetical protein WD766_00410 [Gemmatimonadota bacterium]
MGELMREYERARFPADRRLDVHGEGPEMARERALRWIQSRAHEAPGEELLLIVERGGRPGRSPSPVATAVSRLLADLEGKLVEWWQPFAAGSLALRVAIRPSVLPRPSASAAPDGDGRTEETAGAARPPPAADIPPELMDAATRAAELRIEREELSIRVMDVVLREVWIEAQAIAMEERLSFQVAMDRIVDAERERTLSE